MSVSKGSSWDPSSGPFPGIIHITPKNGAIFIFGPGEREARGEMYTFCFFLTRVRILYLPDISSDHHLLSHFTSCVISDTANVSKYLHLWSFTELLSTTGLGEGLPGER